MSSLLRYLDDQRQVQAPLFSSHQNQETNEATRHLAMERKKNQLQALQARALRQEVLFFN